MTSWQPISTAPRDGTEILAWSPYQWGGGRIVIVSFREDDYRPEDGKKFFDHSFDDFSTSYASTPFDGVTHWMPLPEAP